MNVGIVTQPLCANYGGVLQNYALQYVLRGLSVSPITLDLQTHLNVPYWDYLKEYFKYCIKKYLFKRNAKILPYKQVRPSVFNDFVDKYISITETFHKYSSELIDKYDLDCLIVGSDQVWRPMYNVYPEAMFLDFAKSRKIKKIAYAASFGVDIWELSPQLTDKARILVSDFDAVSVREYSGIKLCKDYLNVKAINVLDPTLLLDKSVYDELAKDIPQAKNDYIAIYTLDITNDVEEKIKAFAKNKGLKIKSFTSDDGFSLSIPEWIASIRDASLVITDSFHGTVFSIVYNKDFYSINNLGRGSSRFESLLSELSLSNRLIDSNQFVISENDCPISWDEVNQKRELLKSMSINFLHQSLGC